jgi:predicted secreted protein
VAFLSLLDAKITINSVVMSTLAKKVTLPFEMEELETTTFGSTWRTRIGGLKDASVEIDWNQDFASSQTDSLLWGLFNSGAVVPVLVKATSGANSATNPEYQGNALPNQYSPFDNSVGELAGVSTKWPGSGAWTRATS